MNKNKKEHILIHQSLTVLGALVVGLFIMKNAPTAAYAYFAPPTAVCDSGAFGACPQGDNINDTASYFAEALAKNVRVMIGAVAIAVIVVAGVKLVANDGNEESLDKQTTTIVYAIIGLMFVAMAGDISAIFKVDKGGFLKDPNSSLQTSRFFSRTVEVMITMIKYIIASISVFGIITSSLRMIMIGSNDDELGKDKKKIGWNLAGLVLIIMANPIINQIFFKIDTNKFPGLETVRPAIDRMALIKEIAGITNIMASFAGPLALLSLVAGGVMYTFAAGDDEKTGRAKKIITWSLIGIIVMYGAFAIVSLFVTREFTGI